MANNKSEIKKLDFGQAERLLRRIIRKLEDKTLDYTIQMSINSSKPGFVTYAAQITAPKSSLEPITWLFSDPDKLIEELKKSEKVLDRSEVEKAYHRAQIRACEWTIKGHQDRISQIEQEKEEQTDAPQEVSNNGQQAPPQIS